MGKQMGWYVVSTCPQMCSLHRRSQCFATATAIATVHRIPFQERSPPGQLRMTANFPLNRTAKLRSRTMPMDFLEDSRASATWTKAVATVRQCSIFKVLYLLFIHLHLAGFHSVSQNLDFKLRIPTFPCHSLCQPLCRSYADNELANRVIFL